LNVGDEPEAALVRECQREFGVLVQVHEPIAAFSQAVFGSELTLYYRCELRSGQPRPKDIVDAVDWFAVSALPDMAFESTAKAIQASQQRLK
jgi:ADP-ribose pyrophosphatase YjhB (NUDIX family)